MMYVTTPKKTLSLGLLYLEYQDAIREGDGQRVQSVSNIFSAYLKRQ